MRYTCAGGGTECGEYFDTLEEAVEFLVRSDMEDVTDWFIKHEDGSRISSEDCDHWLKLAPVIYRRIKNENL